MKRTDQEDGFTLLEVILSLAAIAVFLVLAIDPVLSVQKQKNHMMLETHRLEKMASDQVADSREGYIIKEGMWCIEGLCLASAIRNDAPRSFIGPLAESIPVN